MDTVAEVIAWVVLFVVPIAGIVIFWQLHILPERIAEKRHHPQIEAIKTICLLSLVFGGLLWPIAWIWAYTKPVFHRLAYGPEEERQPGEREGVHEAAPEPARRPALEPVADLRTELHTELDRLQRRLADLERRSDSHREEPS